jgi:hypothetical protein
MVREILQTREVRFVAVGALSDVFQSQVVIHRMLQFLFVSKIMLGRLKPMHAQARTESDQVLPQTNGTIARHSGASHAERDS